MVECPDHENLLIFKNSPIYIRNINKTNPKTPIITSTTYNIQKKDTNIENKPKTKIISPFLYNRP